MTPFQQALLDTALEEYSGILSVPPLPPCSLWVSTKRQTFAHTPRPEHKESVFANEQQREFAAALLLGMGFAQID